MSLGSAIANRLNDLYRRTVVRQRIAESIDGGPAGAIRRLNWNGLEPLEQRLLLSASVASSLVNNVLTVDVTDAANDPHTIVVEDDAAPGSFHVIVDGGAANVYAYPTGAGAGLVINTPGGADTVTLGALDAAFDAPITLNTQGGADAITVGDQTGTGLVTINSGADGDTVVVQGTSADDIFHVTDTDVQRLDSGSNVIADIVLSNTEGLTIQGLAGDDAFDVTASTTQLITLDGGADGTAAGDSVNIDALTAAITGDTTDSSAAGSVSFSGGVQTVSYVDAENVTVSNTDTNLPTDLGVLPSDLQAALANLATAGQNVGIFGDFNLVVPFTDKTFGELLDPGAVWQKLADDFQSQVVLDGSNNVRTDVTTFDVVNFLQGWDGASAYSDGTGSFGGS